MLKKLLTNHINLKVEQHEVALLLSGGVDSISVGLAAENAGKKVTAYTFQLEGNPSYDFTKSQEICSITGWDFVPVDVPVDNLKTDWHRLVEHGCRKKTHFETVFPFLYVYPQIKQEYVLTGWGADGYFGPSKKAMMRYASDRAWERYNKTTDNPVSFDDFRNSYLDGDCAGLQQHTNLANKHEKIHITPYLDSNVRSYLMSMTWQELNKPKQKFIVRQEFNIETLLGKVKPHINLQLGSKVDVLFETLLEDPEINFKHRKRMMDVCRDWYELNINKTIDLTDFM